MSKGKTVKVYVGSEVKDSKKKKWVKVKVGSKTGYVLKKKLENKHERLDQSKEKILREANEEALKIIKEAKDLADETIRNFNKYGQGSAPMSQMEKERSALRDKLSEKEKKLTSIKKQE